EAQTTLPTADLSQRELKSLTELRRKDAPAYGVKASNLGEINRLACVPAGFAIPMYYYHEQLQASGALSEIQSFLKTKEALERIRQKIMAHPIKSEHIHAISQKVEELGLTSLFVRSSTNAEDLVGFNGAGLYDTVGNVTTIEGLEHAIKKVWASVW